MPGTTHHSEIQKVMTRDVREGLSRINGPNAKTLKLLNIYKRGFDNINNNPSKSHRNWDIT